MREHVVAVERKTFELAQKRKVFCRQRARERIARRRQFGGARFQRRRRNAIGLQRLHAAMHEPRRAAHRLLQKEQHGLLVIAEKTARLDILPRGLCDEAIDHAAAIDAAVDVVAKKNEDRRLVIARRFGKIARDLREQRIEQPRAAVNVADGVADAAVREGRFLLRAAIGHASLP